MNISAKGNRFFVTVSLFLCCVLFADAAHAESIGEMFSNFEQTFPQIRRLIGGAFGIIGLLLVIGSLVTFVRHNEGKAEIKTAIGMFFVGIALWQANGMVDVFTNTLYTGASSTDIFSYNPGSMAPASAKFGTAMSGVLGFIQIIGYIAFGRGWLLINQYAAKPGSDGLGRGITHLIGGVMAINVKITVMMLVNTFAPRMSGTIQNFIGG